MGNTYWKGWAQGEQGSGPGAEETPPLARGAGQNRCRAKGAVGKDQKGEQVNRTHICPKSALRKTFSKPLELTDRGPKRATPGPERQERTGASWHTAKEGDFCGEHRCG